jgi:hypothetical protein
MRTTTGQPLRPRLRKDLILSRSFIATADT